MTLPVLRSVVRRAQEPLQESSRLLEGPPHAR